MLNVSRIILCEKVEEFEMREEKENEEDELVSRRRLYDFLWVFFFFN